MRSKTTCCMFIIITALMLPLILSTGTTGAAGSTGEIKGRVTDKTTGDPIVGATVTVFGTSIDAKTGSDGRFVLANLTPGKFNITVTMTGYVLAKISAVSVMADFTTELNIEMEKVKSNENDVASVPIKEEAVAELEVLSCTGIMSNEVAKKMRVFDYCAPGQAADASAYYPPAHGGTAIVNGEPYDAMFFKDYGTNPFVFTINDNLSTFAIDVDDASYIMMRSYLERGNLPPDEAVRTEEFINHFKYNYDPPEEGPFSINIEGAPSIFGENCQLLRIGIKGDVIEPENRKAANLVFVVDVSGSMNREDRLGLVRKALRMLVDNLESHDEVGIVVYGSRGRVVLEPTSIQDKEKILSAIEWLRPEGATNAEEGLRLGYQMAEKNFEKGKINRIILCSDGVANVGVTKAEDILKWIKRHAEKGITLTTVGFGMGNYNDILMEKLGNKGNGFYAYVDDIAEAKKIFMENLTGTLQVIARDVKIQVDFNPDVVLSYRLLGYENRDVADNKFRDDKEDGGEIGSGHQVTALYEVMFKEKPKKSHVAKFFIRYKHPDKDEVDEQMVVINMNDFKPLFNHCSVDFKLAAAAAEFAEILGKSYWAKESKLSDVRELAKDIFRQNDTPEIIELMDLISKAEKLEEQLANK